MPDMHSLETEGQRIYGEAGIRNVRERTAFRLPLTAQHLSETPADHSGSNRRKKEMVQSMTNLEQQIEQMEAMSFQHYPNDESARQAYLVTLLLERLRTYHAKFVPLEVRES